MKVRSIKLKNYRNYNGLDLDLSDNINIFIGRNAQGKTNILEAIYYSSNGSSYRTNTETDLIMWNSPAAIASLIFERMSVESRLDFHFYREKRRQIVHNGQKINAKNLVGIINIVLFSPEDLFLIKGAPAGRRKFLDTEISQASPSYYGELIKYNHILQQRNNLLKKIKENKARKNMLELWDSQLAASAAKITLKRLEAVKKLNMLANLMTRRISSNQENLTVSYTIKNMEKMTDNIELWYNEMMAKSIDEDVWRGFTSIGPHRDDLGIFVNGIDLRAFGSQGQQRTGVLALKLSELEFIRSETGEYPVLLLDDVMSELDSQRRQQLLDFIKRENIQTIITATDEAYFPDVRTGRYFRVEAGRAVPEI